MDKGRGSGFSARQGPKREPYEKVLIVCEGTKTEPNYFNGLKNHLRPTSANVVIAGKGATPLKIISEAEKRYKKESGKGESFRLGILRI